MRARKSLPLSSCIKANYSPEIWSNDQSLYILYWDTRKGGVIRFSTTISQRLSVVYTVLRIGNLCKYYMNYIVMFPGRLIEAISRLIFLLKLILMAKGFTITRGRLSRSGSIKVAVFMTLYTILYAVVFIWESEVSSLGLHMCILSTSRLQGKFTTTIRMLVWLKKKAKQKPLILEYWCGGGWQIIQWILNKC